MNWQYCWCVGSHKPDCPNADDPDGFPPLTEDEEDDDA